MDKVFLLEDSVYLHSRYIYPLKFNQVEVVPFTDGEELIERLEGEVPSLLLLDYVFLGKRYTGLDIAKKVKEKFPSLNMIIVSGNLNSELEEQFKTVGVHDFIVKPFTNEELVNKTLKKLGREKG